MEEPLSPELAALAQSYAARFPVEPCDEGAVERVEAALGVTFPDDAKAIASFFHGDLIGGIEHYELTDRPTSFSIVEKTMALRQSIGLPRAFVALAEPPESLILWNVPTNEVVWCDSYDVDRIVNGATPASQPQRWPSYADFFRYLLEQES